MLLPTASRRLALALGLAFVAPACGGSTASDSSPGVHSGGGSGGASGSGGNGGTGGSTSPGLTGVWKGYVEGYAFDDGANTVTLTLESVTPDVSGQIQFGDKPLLPPPTDPNVGYPPGINFLNGSAPTSVVSGFVYTIVPKSFDGQRLKFQVMAGELWKDWCALQTPIYDEGFHDYFCVHNWGLQAGGPGGCTQIDPNTGKANDIDCGKEILCEIGGVCGCNAQSCSPNGNNGGPTLDMQFVPPDADGDVGGLGWAVYKVHLEKQ